MIFFAFYVLRWGFILFKAFKYFSGLLLTVLLSNLAHAATPPEIPAPTVAAQAWLLVDHDSGSVLAERNADKPLAPASLTKLMTAYVLFGKMKSGTLRLDDPVTIGQQAWNAKGARLFLRPGTTARVEDLLKGMIVLSANDAAQALAVHTAKSEAGFVIEMNVAAQALEMRNTVFLNTTGHDQKGHVSTARDLARLSSALIRDFPDYYKWFALKEFSYLDITHYNRNALLWRDRSVDGLKTGETRSAGSCLIATASRDGMRLIATVLGAADENARVEAGQKLLDHGFSQYETRLLYTADVPAVRVRVWLGDQSSLPLGVRENLYLTLPRGWHEKLHARLVVKEMLQAPVMLGQAMGTLALDIDRQPFSEYPLVALKEIETGNFLQRAIDRIQLWLR